VKAYQVVLTPRAERQVADLYAYISDHSGAARADQFVGGILESCASLSTFPERGTKRDDIRPGFRTMGYAKRATIVFSVFTQTGIVAIHGIFYGGQNFEILFGQTNPDD
jgi:toxin ParE1/3/4